VPSLDFHLMARVTMCPASVHNTATASALQDDMQLAVDFFPYFRRTAQLLDEDPTLYCVSSWNDNGQV
jgi:GNT-I family